MTERSGHVDCPENLVPGGCSDHEGHLDHPDNPVVRDWTDHRGPRGTWGHKESRDQPGSRESPAPRVSLDRRARSDSRE